MHLRSLRRLSVVALAAALAILATLASSSTAGVATSSASGRLVVGRTADIDQFDPHKATAFQSVQTLQLIYGTLVQLTPSLDIVPDLATSWKFSDGAQTLTLQLRKNVKFQNGAGFDSTDVKASLNRILDPATAAVARSNLSPITSIDTPSATTVVLHMNTPDVPILAALADINAAILSSQDIASGSFVKAPNGTGPFRFVGWQPGQSLTLANNPRYYGKAVKLAQVVFRIIPDESSIVSALRANQVQLGLISDPLVARQVKGGGLKVFRTPSLNYHVLQLNARHGPLTKQYARLAIQCALDRNEVLQSAALGEGSVIGPITSPAYRSNPNADRVCPKPNLTKARKFLQAAGFPNGFSIETIVETGEYATAVNEAQSAQAQLKKVGINLDLKILDAGTYVKRWLAADFDAAIALNGGRVDPDTMYNRYFTSNGSLNKVAGFASPKLDQLFAQGRATDNVKLRKSVYRNITKMLEGQAAWVWLFSSYDYRIATSKVKGFLPMPNGSLQYLRQTSLS
jgi:peptide/nickel transport system substrate-binding protein